MKITAFPLVKVGFGFIAGMMAYPHVMLTNLYVLGLLFAAYFWFELRKWHIQNFPWIALITLYAFSFFLGNVLYTRQVDRVVGTQLPERHLVLNATVLRAPATKTFHIEVRVAISAFQGIQPSSFSRVPEVLLKFSRQDTAILSVRRGDVLYLAGVPVSISAPKNPSRFNRKTYLLHQGIIQEIRVFPECWHFLKNHTHHSLRQVLERQRWIFSDKIDACITGSKEKSIVKALLLGVREGMSPDVLNSFSNSGTIHVLAVSGLHVGAVLFVFVWLLERVKNKGILFTWCKLVLLISLAVMYVVLTGFSPSVIRAVIMFSCILIGKFWFTETNAMNLLWVCATWMLIYNPFYLHDLSFQFSFLSLGGILLFQPELKNWWQPGSRVLRYFWELTSVSISAQIFVFPLAIYYFHQFPMYFIVGSILAIPMVLVLVYGGFLLPIAFLVEPTFSKSYVTLYSKLVSLLLQSMQGIEKLPFSVWKDIYFDAWDVLLAYLMIIGLLYYSLRQKVIGLYLSIVFMLFMSLQYMFTKQQQNAQARICFYDVKGSYVFDVFYGSTAFCYKSSKLNANIEKFNCYFNRLKNGIQNIVYVTDSVDLEAEKLACNYRGGRIHDLSWSVGQYQSYDYNKLNFKLFFIHRKTAFDSCESVNFCLHGLVILSNDLTKRQKDIWTKCLSAQNIPSIDLSANGYLEYEVAK